MNNRAENKLIPGTFVQILFGQIGKIEKVIYNDHGKRTVIVINYDLLSTDKDSGVRYVSEGYGVTTPREKDIGKLDVIEAELV